MTRILPAVAGLNPHYRMRPELPFVTDPLYYSKFKNLYLVTDVGPIDFLGEVDGIGDYPETLKNSEVAELDGRQFRVLTIPALIRAKTAAGRPKDWEAIQQLEALQRGLDEKK
jgi:hypothetical protein